MIGIGSRRTGDPGAGPRARRDLAALLAALRRADLDLYQRTARLDRPVLDWAMPRLSAAADHGRLWLVLALLMTLSGRPAWRRAAWRGIASLALASASVNLVGKLAVNRRRPPLDSVALLRRVRRVPVTTSFPSGHAASAAAFTTGVALESPELAVPVGVLAAAVAWSRVWTGAHYPGDIAAGALLGAGLGLALARVRPGHAVRDPPEPARHA